MHGERAVSSGRMGKQEGPEVLCQVAVGVGYREASMMLGEGAAKSHAVSPTPHISMMLGEGAVLDSEWLWGVFVHGTG